MNDDPIDTEPIDDDEFGQRLRDAVPEPGPGYWQTIDATLTDIERDTDGSVVRLMDMTNSQTPTTIRRRAPLLAAAAIVVLVGAIAGVIAISQRATDDSLDVAAEPPDPTMTADIGDSADTPSSDPSCYLGDETPIGLVVRLEETADGVISAATYFAPGGADDTIVTVAEGTILDDGRTLQMLEVTVGAGIVSTQLWQRTDVGLFLGEDVAARLTDCEQVSAQLGAIDGAVAAQANDPLEEMRARGELSGADPAIEPGTYCFANREEGFPSDRYIRLTVNDDATATAAISDDEPPSATATASGSFTTPTELVMRVERSADSEPVTTTLEVWRFEPLTGRLTNGPLFFTLDPVSCADVDGAFEPGQD